MHGTFKALRHSMQKSRSARLGGLSNAWRKGWATKRYGKPAMAAWIAGERIYAGAKIDCGVIPHGGRILARYHRLIDEKRSFVKTVVRCTLIQ
jgi:hypothetical protein